MFLTTEPSPQLYGWHFKEILCPCIQKGGGYWSDWSHRVAGEASVKSVFVLHSFHAMLWFGFPYLHEEWCSCQQHGWQVLFLCVASCISHQHHSRKEPTVSFVLMALFFFFFDSLTVLSQTWDVPAPDCWARRPVPHTCLNVLLQYSPPSQVGPGETASILCTAPSCSPGSMPPSVLPLSIAPWDDTFLRQPQLFHPWKGLSTVAAGGRCPC